MSKNTLHVVNDHTKQRDVKRAKDPIVVNLKEGTNQIGRMEMQQLQTQYRNVTSLVFDVDLLILFDILIAYLTFLKSFICQRFLQTVQTPKRRTNYPEIKLLSQYRKDSYIIMLPSHPTVLTHPCYKE